MAGFGYMRFIKPAFILMIIVTAFANNAQSQQNEVWDTLYFTNGQVIYGTLKKVSLGRVDFDIEGVSLQNIKISKLKTIEASKRFYRIETIDHKVIFSTISPNNKPGYITIDDSTKGVVSIPLNYISFLSYYSSRKNIWEGSVSSGYNFTRSSKIGRFNFDGSLRYVMKSAESLLTASSIITGENGTWKRERELVRLSYAFFINALLRVGGLLSYQRNLELGLQRRYQEGAFLGLTYLSLRKMKGDLITGLVYNQERNTNVANQRNTFEIPFLLTYDFFSFSKPEVSIKTTQNLFVSLSDRGRFRHDGELRIDWKVISDFSISVKLYDNYDSKPPSAEARNVDYGIIFGLTYKFD
jgi:hypothetical protein